MTFRQLIDTIYRYVQSFHRTWVAKEVGRLEEENKKLLAEDANDFELEQEIKRCHTAIEHDNKTIQRLCAELEIARREADRLTEALRDVYDIAHGYSGPMAKRVVRRVEDAIPDWFK